MKPENRKNLLITIAMATAVVCVVVLFFFRTSVFTGFFRKTIRILKPFIYGIVIAYLLYPLSRRLEEKLHLKRILAILLSVAFMFALAAILLIAVIPELMTSLTELVRGIPGTVNRAEVWLSGLLESQGELLHTLETYLNLTTESIETFLKSNVLPQLRNLVTNMSKNFSGLLSVLKNFLLGSIIAVYLLESREKFVLQVKMVVYALFPHKMADWIREEARFTNEKISGFIVGKVIDSLIIGIICFAFVLITRTPYAMLISIIVGVTNMVPFFGPYLGAVPSAILLLTVSPFRCLVFVIFIMLLQQLDGNVIGPRILGNKLGLSAFWILFAILVFGSIWGIPGMLVGAPVFAILYDIARHAVVAILTRKEEKEILNQYGKQKAPAKATPRADQPDVQK